MEVDGIIGGQGDHGGIGNHRFETCRQPFPHSPESCSRDQRLAFAVDEVRTPKDLGITMQNCWDNMVAKETQVPDEMCHKYIYV
jgi:hypothetical protein